MEVYHDLTPLELQRAIHESRGNLLAEMSSSSRDHITDHDLFTSYGILGGIGQYSLRKSPLSLIAKVTFEVREATEEEERRILERNIFAFLSPIRYLSRSVFTTRVLPERLTDRLIRESVEEIAEIAPSGDQFSLQGYLIAVAEDGRISLAGKASIDQYDGLRMDWGKVVKSRSKLLFFDGPAHTRKTDISKLKYQ